MRRSEPSDRWDPRRSMGCLGPANPGQSRLCCAPAVVRDGTERRLNVRRQCPARTGLRIPRSVVPLRLDAIGGLTSGLPGRYGPVRIPSSGGHGEPRRHNRGERLARRPWYTSPLTARVFAHFDIRIGIVDRRPPIPGDLSPLGFISRRPTAATRQTSNQATCRHVRLCTICEMVRRLTPNLSASNRLAAAPDAWVALISRTFSAVSLARWFFLPLWKRSAMFSNRVPQRRLSGRLLVGLSSRWRHSIPSGRGPWNAAHTIAWTGTIFLAPSILTRM